MQARSDIGESVAPGHNDNQQPSTQQGIVSGRADMLIRIINYDTKQMR